MTTPAHGYLSLKCPHDGTALHREDPGADGVGFVMHTVVNHGDFWAPDPGAGLVVNAFFCPTCQYVELRRIDASPPDPDGAQ